MTMFRTRAPEMRRYNRYIRPWSPVARESNGERSISIPSQSPSMSEAPADTTPSQPTVFVRRTSLMDYLDRMDCYADDREALNDYERYFNNAHLCDVTLVVGEESYSAHRLVLVKSSEVFERMLSDQWSGDKKEIELVEDNACVKVFAAFLRFMYCNHVILDAENTLPILILADKYNVTSLRKVCLEYAIKHIIPQVSLKDLFHVWFQYGTKTFHKCLVNTCTDILANCFEEIISSPEWEKEWLSLDRDQLAEFLKCSELTVQNEYKIWEAVQHWIQAPSHPERRGNTCAPMLAIILPLIRFPFMTPDEINQLERSPLAEQHPKIFQPQIMASYKFQAMPLSSRAGVKEFATTQFLLRNYTELRWDKRICIQEVTTMPRYTEVTMKLQTRASAVPPVTWDWELKVHPRGFSSASEDMRIILSSNVILDQTRAVEFLLSIVDEKKVVRSVAGKRTFTKTRYSHDLEIDKKIGVEELLSDNSPLLVNKNLYLQLTLKPID